MSARVGKIQLRRGTAAAWTSANPTLLLGEIGLETDTGNWKTGDGATAWNSLNYPSQLILARTALPTGGSIVTGQIVRLTAADDTAKAPPGLFKHDGTGWICLECTAPYALGNLGAAPTLTAIPGCKYTAVQDQNITTEPAITFTRPGIIKIAKSGAFTVVAKCAMAGRTAKEAYTDSWTPSGGALATWLIEDDGTYIVSAASTLV